MMFGDYSVVWYHNDTNVWAGLVYGLEHVRGHFGVVLAHLPHVSRSTANKHLSRPRHFACLAKTWGLQPHARNGGLCGHHRDHVRELVQLSDSPGCHHCTADGLDSGVLGIDPHGQLARPRGGRG